MPTINAYLNFNGNTEEVFNFYQSVFGGEFAQVMRFKEVPAEFRMPAGQSEKIMHISLPIGKNVMLMGSDAVDGHGIVRTGTNISLSLHTDSQADADNFFEALSKEGKPTMPMSQSFWGSYFGMLTDQFDIQWLISYDGKTSK